MTKTEKVLAELDRIGRDCEVLRKNCNTYRKAHQNEAAKAEAFKTLLVQAMTDEPGWKERAAAVMEATA